ncbi:MAG: DNA photolyase [Desulfamplus sp.]|nr:DNA photolyase [Desulfamplus sp.]
MKIETLFIDRAIRPCEEIDYIIQSTSLEPEYVENSKVVYDHVNLSDDPITKGKQTLYITENHGAVIKKCPGTSHYTCCDYTILHTGTFCTMDCSYCILQAYFHPPLLQYFVGQHKIDAALDEIFKEKKTFRVGTGEFTDSLIWDKISNQPAKLVRKFADQARAISRSSNNNFSILELKTKTVNIDSLKDIDHNRKTVVAWSLNTPKVIKSEERGTASLSARLKAAKECERWGYRVAFHFDPIVIYEGCEEDYKEVIKSIFEGVRVDKNVDSSSDGVIKKSLGILPDSIVWISIGTFRFMPQLKQIIENRFPKSTIAYGEFITGLDNKMRYFKPLRIKIYQKIVSFIRQYAPDVLIYFCMEDEEVWQKTIGFFPKKEGQLGAMLDRSVMERCKSC